MYSKTYSPIEAAKFFYCTPTTVQKWCREYRIGIRIGGRFRISQEVVDLICSGTPINEIYERVYGNKKD